MTVSEHLQNRRSCGVFPVGSRQYLPQVAQGRSSHRRAIVSQIAEEVCTGFDRKVPELSLSAYGSVILWKTLGTAFMRVILRRILSFKQCSFKHIS